MVLDDDPVTRESLVQLLDGYGYEAFAVGEGAEALRAVEDDRCDIALVDLKMPGMDGIEVLRRLKAIRPSVQVIMITAYATVETAVEAMKLGAFDYIMKPFKGEMLDASIRGSIEETEFQRGLLESRPSDMARSVLEMFREALQVRRGLVLSRDDPEELVTDHGLVGADVRWMTTDGTVDGRVDPSDLEGIAGLVTTFARGNHRSVVLIHGVELLVHANGPDRVTVFLRDLVDGTQDVDAVLLVSARPGTITGSAQMEMENLFRRGSAQEMSESLANPTRRAVVQHLSQSGTSSFTDILSNVPEKESPKLSFHLKKLVNFDVIAKDDDGRYHLTERGESLVLVLRDLDGVSMRESRAFFSYDFE